jgi:acetyl esterase
MLRMHVFCLFVIFLLFGSVCFSQERVLYKKIDSTELYMEVYRPEKLETYKNYPAMVFYFGGGWNGGSIHQFLKHAEYFSKRGIVCFLVDYRVKNRNNTSPFESLKDAKSAIRFIRGKSKDFNVDPKKIIAVGGSAGGHLAAATALIDGFDELTEDLSIGAISNALVLFNPVIDNGPGGYGFERIGAKYKDFSPLHNIRKSAPPTLIFLGTEDALIPLTTAEYYKTVMNKVGSRCDLKVYEGQSHCFFNYNKFEYYRKTVIETDLFLQSLGFLSELPIVKIE